MATDIEEKKKPPEEEDEESRKRYAPGEEETIKPIPGTAAPRTQGTIPAVGTQSPQEGTSEYTRGMISNLEGKLNQPAPTTRLGKIGRVFRNIGEGVGGAVAPGVMLQIPGTRLNTMAQLQAQRGMLEEQQGREARTRLGEETLDVERQKAGIPQISAHAPERYYTDENGIEHVELPVERRGQGIEYKEISPTMLQPPSAAAGPPAGQIAPVTAPPAGPPERTAAAAAPPPMGEPTPAPAAPQRKYTYGPKKELSAEQQLKDQFMQIGALPETQRSAEQQQFFNQHVGQFGKELAISAPDMKQKNDSMNDDYARVRSVLGNDAPKPNLIVPNDNYDTAEKKHADYSDKVYKAITLKNEQDTRRGLQNLQSQMLEDKLAKERGDAAAQADQAWYGLYSQKNYQDRVHTWHQTGNYVRDSGLITEQLGGEHGGGGVSLGPFAGVLSSTPQGAVAAVGADALVGIVRNTLNGYLDTAKKAGISDPGYQAMTAYANAIVGRMQYELGAAGIRASALRMRDVMQKVLMTVPPPNTPPEAFDRAFNQYYKTMENAVGRRQFGGVSKDYVKPKYEDVFPPESAGKGQWNPVTGTRE